MGRRGIKLAIKLHNSHPTVSSGSTVAGNVELYNGALIDVKSIIISIRGEARTCFDQEYGSVMYKYKGSETYFQEVKQLLGNNEDANNASHATSFPPCTTTLLPFEFTLPTGLTLPSSLNFTDCLIRYILTAKMKTSNNKYNAKTRCNLQFKGTVDLNSVPSARKEFREEKRSNFHFWCFKSGPITYKVTLPRTGFIHGEPVPFRFSVINNSSLEIRPTIRLVCVVNCKGERLQSEAKSKQTKLVILRELGATILPDDTYLWDGGIGQNLKIPSTVPPTITSEQSQIIRLTYFLEFEAVAAKTTHVLFSTKVPVCIGTVPLTDVPRVGQITTERPMNHGLWDSSFIRINEMPPPSYEEAINMSEDKSGVNLQRLGNPEQMLLH